MARSYWLLKTEPMTYSFAQLLKDRKTHWNDVRNYQARNFLKEISVGDRALIYHSGDDKAVMGIAEIIRAAYPDPDPEDPKTEWVQVDLKPVLALPESVSLATLKATPALKDLMLIRQSRLSVMPVTATQFQTIVKLGGAKP